MGFAAPIMTTEVRDAHALRRELARKIEALIPDEAADIAGEP